MSDPRPSREEGRATLAPIVLKALAFGGGMMLLVGVSLLASSRAPRAGVVLIALGAADLMLAAIWARRT